MKLTLCWMVFAMAGCLLVTPRQRALACCPAAPRTTPVVNADQTVTIVWNPATHTEHFIRRASFKSAADDFGFIIPTPSQPTLSESGNEAFGFLQKVTAPAVERVPRPTGMSCGCSKEEMFKAAEPVTVLEQKTVAGYDAVVLRATSAGALVDWLKAHGYALSPEVEAWAKPYVDGHWTLTALKIVKGAGAPDVTASALRLSFKTDRPLFPYREPDPRTAAAALGARQRLLRIYFLSDARYAGALGAGVAWTGATAWADRLPAADRERALNLLHLPPDAAPANCYLTEFEDPWPYALARGDLYFSPSPDQSTVKRPPNIEYIAAGRGSDLAVLLLPFAMLIPRLARRRKKA